MWRQGLVIVALCVSAASAELAPVLAGAGTGAHCDDAVCRCHRRGPARPAPASSCHESRQGTDCEMSAACHHGEQAAPAAARPQVLPAVAVLLTPPPVLSIVPVSRAFDQPGHLRRDLPPPRLVS